MEPQHPPSKLARFADSGWSDSWNMETNGSNGGGASIGLGLELESGSGYRASGYKTKCCGFTIFQMHELHLQSLIYKYMEAGLPVPSHLVLPIWKSVDNSFTGLTVTAALHQLYPGFLGSGGLHLEFRNGMNPEPGRCRRTDGKKWRCSKEAVPDHKYCERHLHRGRSRSRKLVEAASSSSSSGTALMKSSGVKKNTITNTNLSISLPAVNI